MRRFMPVAILAFLFGFLVMAPAVWGLAYATGPSWPAQVSMPGGSAPLTSVDLMSYCGLAASVVALVEVLKLLWKSWVSGKELILSLGLTLVIGPVTKLTVPHAYENVPWVIFLVSLVVLQVPLNKILHDSTLQPLTDAAKK